MFLYTRKLSLSWIQWTLTRPQPCETVTNDDECRDPRGQTRGLGQDPRGQGQIFWPRGRGRIRGQVDFAFLCVNVTYEKCKNYRFAIEGKGSELESPRSKPVWFYQTRAESINICSDIINLI